MSKTPDIVANYDKVFVKTNANGDLGLAYVKVSADNVVYYVEAVTTQYHNKKLLVNKQMVKAGIDEIPNLNGLVKAINKKESSSQYLADLKEIRKAYVQDVKGNYSNNSISQNQQKSTPADEKSLSPGDSEWFYTMDVKADEVGRTVMAVAQNTAQNTVQSNVYNTAYSEQDLALTQPVAASAPMSAPDTNYSLPNSNLDNESQSGYNENKNDNIGSDKDGEEQNTATERELASSRKGTSKEDVNRHGIQNESGRKKKDDQRETTEFRGRLRRGLKQSTPSYPKDSYISPRHNTVEAYECEKLAEYGIESYVIKKSNWDRESIAYVNNGKVYMREDIDEVYRNAVAIHEATHVMKQLGYEPYLNFLSRTPDMVIISSEFAQLLIEEHAEHYDIDILSASQEQLSTIYDEMNSTIFGSYMSGRIDETITEELKNAFYDFDAYINELSEIHEQFKKANTASDAENTHENARKDEKTGDSTPEGVKTPNKAKKSSESKKETPANNAGVTKLSASENNEASPGVDEASTADDSRAPSTAKEQTEARRYYKDFDFSRLILARR